MPERKSNKPLSQSVTCPECGANLAEAFIRKLAAPQVEQVRLELEHKLDQQVDVRAAEMLATLNAKLEQQEHLRKQAAADHEQQIGVKVAELAEKDEKLKQAYEAEADLRDQKRRLEDDRAEWDLQIARLRDEITGQERARSTQQIEHRIKLEHDRIEQQYLDRIEQLESYTKHQDEQLAASAEQRTELEQALTARAEAEAAKKVAALEKQLKDKQKEERERAAEFNRRLEGKDAEIAEQKAELETQVTAKHAEEMARLRLELKQQKQAQQFSKDAWDDQLQERDAEIAEQRKQLQQMQTAEREIRTERRKLQDAQDNWEVEQARMRDRIVLEERELAHKNAEIQYKAKIEAMQQHEQGLRDQLEAAHRKASTGTRPQQEGVARQELFADELRNRWPGDDIRVIKQGQKGADVIQTVRDGRLDCGTIVWECKWTQGFQHKWVAKLTEDAKAHGAKIAVLVSAVLPRDIDGSGFVDRTLVCDFTTAVHIVEPCRRLVIASKRHELANSARGTAELVYDYVTTGGFAACLHKIITSVQAGMRNMELFDNYMTRFMANWNKAQQDIIDSIYTMVGEIEAAGTELPAPLHTELPTGERLALLPPEDAAEESDDPDQHDTAA